MEKICRICEKELLLSFFHKDNSRKDGYRSICKDCVLCEQRKRREKFKKINKHEQTNNDNKACSKCKLTKTKEMFFKNAGSKDGLHHQCKDCLKTLQKENNYSNKWKNKNKEKINKRRKELRQRKEAKEKEAKYYRKRRKTDSFFRLKQLVSSSVRKALTKMSISKDKSPTWLHLPYTPQQLKEHIESQFTPEMSWENHGTYWHIDHIFPQSLLPYDSFDHPNFQKCWALENLRPLEATENLRKGKKIIENP